MSVTACPNTQGPIYIQQDFSSYTLSTVMYELVSSTIVLFIVIIWHKTVQSVTLVYIVKCDADMLSSISGGAVELFSGKCYVKKNETQECLNLCDAPTSS